MLALIGTAAVTVYFGVTEPVVTFSGSYVTDPASGVLKIFAYVALGVTFLYSREYLAVNGLLKGEFFVLGLFGLLGIMIMISAHSLLSLYLGLELLALSQYTLVAFNRDSAVSAESAMKYFVLGAIASGSRLASDRAGSVSRRCSRSRSSSSASRSSSAPCRSTCGCPTSTRARRRP